MSTYEGEHTIFGFLSQANLRVKDLKMILYSQPMGNLNARLTKPIV
jgi:hypothetical protein